MNLSTFFTQLGFTEKEKDIFLTLYKLGSSPASTIAKHLNMERTTVYKTLLKMADEGIVTTTQHQGVKHFFVPDTSILKKYMNTKKQQLQNLEDNFWLIENELSQYNQQKYSHLPKISLFDGVEGVKNMYNDIYETTTTNRYLVIKFFATNTFEDQISVHATVKDYYENLFEKLKKQQVMVDAFIGNGILILEQISRTNSIEHLSGLPAGNSTINLFIVGGTVYLIIFKSTPFGIKIESKDLANVLHVILENVKTE